ncbi:hypothetical protein ACOMHN_018179 [Nucella lapillus]
MGCKFKPKEPRLSSWAVSSDRAQPDQQEVISPPSDRPLDDHTTNSPHRYRCVLIKKRTDQGIKMAVKVTPETSSVKPKKPRLSSWAVNLSPRNPKSRHGL